MSPPVKKIATLKNGFYGIDQVIGGICSIIVVGAIYQLVKIDTHFWDEETKNIEIFKNLIAIMAFSGTAYYMFTRFQRHEKMYNEANGVKEEETTKETDIY